MITNAGASELLQPGDRRGFWKWAQSPAGGTTEWAVVFELANGVSVQGRGIPVEYDGCLVGVVLHLSVEAGNLGQFVSLIVPLWGLHFIPSLAAGGLRPAFGLVRPHRLGADRG